MPAIVDQVLASPGQPLPDGVRSRFEAGIGHDFSQVRVHTDATAATSAQQIQAAAYTHKNHIAFGSSRYAPETTSGQHLLAHELAHVVQQSRSGSSSTGLELGAPDSEAERNADAVAHTAINNPGAGTAIPAMGIGTVQRAGESDAAGASAPEPLPRSLNQTLDPAALSDREIEQEVHEIRAWLDAHPASNPAAETLAQALGRLAHESVARHLRAQRPRGTPRSASSITAADVRRASAAPAGGAVAGFVSTPGLEHRPV